MDGEGGSAAGPSRNAPASKGLRLRPLDERSKSKGNDDAEASTSRSALGKQRAPGVGGLGGTSASGGAEDAARRRVVRVTLKSDFGEATNVFRGVSQRETGLCTRIRKRPFLDELACSCQGDGRKGAGTLVNLVNDEMCPPFALQFGASLRSSHLLAVADEDGYVTVTDTLGDDLPQSKQEEHQPRIRWAAHDNSIFDLTWSHGDEYLTTVSGDETVKIWSAETQQLAQSLRGHTGSIKTVSYKRDNESVLATAGRDGTIAFWDLRDRRQQQGQSKSAAAAPASSSSPSSSPAASGGQFVKAIRCAHGGSNIAPTLRRKRQHTRNKPDKSSLKSVTTVLFLRADTNVLASSGSDGFVKFWDARNLKAPTHLVTLPQPASWARSYGIPSIAEDPSGTRLAVSAFNDSIYLYNCLRPERGPSQQVFTGHDVGSFYIKLAFSPDGSHLLSGSSDSNAYIWQVDRPEDGPYAIKGHQGEVSGVSWCSGDFNKIATCSDDSTFRVWNVRHRRERQERARKIARPPTVRLYHSGGSEGSSHMYMNELVTSSPRQQTVGTHTLQTYIDCSGIDTPRGERRPNETRPQQYRNPTLDELWSRRDGDVDDK